MALAALKTTYNARYTYNAVCFACVVFGLALWRCMPVKLQTSSLF